MPQGQKKIKEVLVAEGNRFCLKLAWVNTRALHMHTHIWTVRPWPNEPSVVLPAPEDLVAYRTSRGISVVHWRDVCIDLLFATLIEHHLASHHLLDLLGCLVGGTGRSHSCKLQGRWGPHWSSLQVHPKGGKTIEDHEPLGPYSSPHGL